MVRPTATLLGVWASDFSEKPLRVTSPVSLTATSLPAIFSAERVRERRDMEGQEIRLKS